MLTGLGSAKFPDLPLISGEGAAAEAEGLLALVARYPGIARRLEEAERVAERRWTLKLSRAVTLVLPADREAAVLEEITKGGSSPASSPERRRSSISGPGAHHGTRGGDAPVRPGSEDGLVMGSRSWKSQRGRRRGAGA